jgi:hypothetical protein
VKAAADGLRFGRGAIDETPVAGSGNITIRNLSENTETVIPVGDPQVTLSGTTLTIDPAVDLAPGDEHAVRIDPGALTDTLGNPFAGISDDTSWNFITAADTTPPAIGSLSPADEGAVRATGKRVAAFSEPITVPAPTLLTFDFEATNGGFTVATTAGSPWAYGTPDSLSPGGTIDRGNGAESGGGSCWGTNLGAYAGGTGDPGYYAVPTTSCLRSAPAQLDLIDAMNCRIRSGTAVANVPQSAIGFRIETPSARVIDHGTRFSVTVHPATGGTLTQVFDGLVDVENPTTGEIVALKTGQSNSIVGRETGPVTEGLEELIQPTIPTPRRSGPESIAVTSSKDAYVGPCLKNDSEVLLYVKTGEAGFNRKAYLGFDLS